MTSEKSVGRCQKRPRFLDHRVLNFRPHPSGSGLFLLIQNLFAGLDPDFWLLGWDTSPCLVKTPLSSLIRCLFIYIYIRYLSAGSAYPWVKQTPRGILCCSWKHHCCRNPQPQSFAAFLACDTHGCVILKWEVPMFNLDGLFHGKSQQKNGYHPISGWLISLKIINGMISALYLKILLWLVVDFPPLQNDGVKVSWDDFPFPIWWKKSSIHVPNHPPVLHQLDHQWQDQAQTPQRPAAWCPASLSARRLRRWSLEIPPEMAVDQNAEVNVTCYPKGVGEIFGEILGEILGEMLLRCRCLTHQFDHLTGI